MGYGSKSLTDWRDIVLLDDPMSEPELMYSMCTDLCVTIEEVIAALAAES
jgi:hypothetical protein